MPSLNLRIAVLRRRHAFRVLFDFAPKLNAVRKAIVIGAMDAKTLDNVSPPKPADASNEKNVANIPKNM